MGVELRERLSRTDRDERELLLARDRQRVPLRRVVAAAPPYHVACRNVSWAICCTAFFRERPAASRGWRLASLRAAQCVLPSPRYAAHSMPRHVARLVARACAAGACRAAQRRKFPGSSLRQRNGNDGRRSGAAPPSARCNAAADLLRFPGRMSPAHASSASTASAFTCAGARPSAAALCHLGPCPLRPARCTLHLARCILHVASCTSHVARCMLSLGRGTLHVACCKSPVARCTS
jgi:hypothetical protein